MNILQTIIAFAGMPRQLTRIEQDLDTIIQHQYIMANTIDEIFALAKAETDAEQAVLKMLAEVQATITDKTTLSTQDQATVDAIFGTLSGNLKGLIAAAHVGTPTEDATDAPAVAAFEAAPPEPLVP